MTKGSHNSFTFMHPQWYLRPFAFIGRCQSKTIEEQWAAGVRLFDLRIRCDKDGKPMIVHNSFVYTVGNGQVCRLLYDIAELAIAYKEKPYVRILHDIRRESQDTSKELSAFRNICHTLKVYYGSNINFIGGNNLIDWRVDYPFPFAGPEIAEMHASICWPKWAHWWPWLYARLHNAENLENMKGYPAVLLYDFV